MTTTTWDFESRQRAVELPDDSRVTFTYNCDDWRISKEDSFQTVGYQWDNHVLLAELGDVQAQVDSSATHPFDKSTITPFCLLKPGLSLAGPC